MIHSHVCLAAWQFGTHRWVRAQLQRWPEQSVPLQTCSQIPKRVLSQPCEPSLHACCVGDWDGELLGPLVGPAVGESVADGDIEGDLEGFTVGFAVGKVVGLFEGRLVIHSHVCLAAWQLGTH